MAMPGGAVVRLFIADDNVTRGSTSWDSATRVEDRKRLK